MDRPEFHGEITNIFPEHQEGVAIDLMDNLLAGGRKFVIRLSHERLDDPMNVSFVDMCPDNARALAELLADASYVADAFEPEKRAGIIGVRELPTINLCGVPFIIDARMRQLRNAENPNHFFDLDDPFSM